VPLGRGRCARVDQVIPQAPTCEEMAGRRVTTSWRRSGWHCRRLRRSRERYDGCNRPCRRHFEQLRVGVVRERAGARFLVGRGRLRWRELPQRHPWRFGVDAAGRLVIVGAFQPRAPSPRCGMTSSMAVNAPRSFSDDRPSGRSPGLTRPCDRSVWHRPLPRCACACRAPRCPALGRGRRARSRSLSTRQP
jgi:hypothetical protein